MLDKVKFAAGIDEYRPVVMWFWNDSIEEEEIRRQIDGFYEQRIYQFYIHPLSGFEIEYLSERFFELVGVAIEHASKLGMKFWIYDEYNWPSGMVGGKLLREYPEYRMVVVKHKHIWVYQGQTVKMDFAGRLLRAQAVDGGTMRDVTAEGIADDSVGTFTWRNSSVAPVALYLFSEVKQGGVFAAAMLSRYSDYQEGYLDTMNPDAVRKFLDMTHEQYAVRFKEHLGHTLAGVFTDEPNLANPFDFGPDTIPWTSRFDQVFREANGYDLLPHLIELVTETGDYRRIRYDFWRTLTERFAAAYAKQMAAWCEQQNIILTGHVSGEENLIADLLQSGNAFTFLQHFHIPAIDSIFSKQRIVNEDFNLAGKLVTSIAEHTGATRTMCETYTGSGWDMSMEEMKHIFNRLAVLGVNTIQFMGAYYSIRGLRRRLPISYPPSHNFQNPLWPYYGMLSDYMSRLCYANSRGTHGADIAVLMPTTSVFSEYAHRHNFRQCMKPYQERKYGDPDITESTLHGINNTLLQIQRDFDLLHEPSFLEAEIVGNSLHFRGHTYKQLIMPSIMTLTGELWDKLSAFMAAGGHVCYVNLLPAHCTDRGEIAGPFETATGLSPEAAMAEVRTHWAVGSEKMTRVSERGNITYIVSNELSQTDNAGLRDALKRCLAWIEPPLSLTESCNHVFVNHRRLGDRDLFILVNETAETYEGAIRVHKNGSVTVLDPQTGGDYVPECISGNGFVDILIPLSDFQALVIEVTPKLITEAAKNSGAGDHASSITLELIGEWEFAPSDGLNYLRLDMEVSAGDSGVWHPAPGYIFPRGAGFELDAPYEARAAFNIAELPRRLEMAIDPEEEKTIMVNGMQLKPDRTEHVWDRTNVVYNIAELVKPGLNTIHVKGRIPPWGAEHATVFAVLLGTFGVDAGRVVTALPNTQNVPGSWTEQGFPDLSGTGVYRRVIQLDAAQAVSKSTLQVGNCRDVVELWCNGVQVGVSLWNPHSFDLSGRLREGANVLELRVTNTLSNLLEKPEPSGLTGKAVLKIVR